MVHRLRFRYCRVSGCSCVDRESLFVADGSGKLNTSSTLLALLPTYDQRIPTGCEPGGGTVLEESPDLAIRNFP